MPAKRTVLLEGAMTIKWAFSLSCSWTAGTMTRGLSRPERTMREKEEVARRERWRRRVALGAKIYRDLLLRCLFILLAAPIPARASLSLSTPQRSSSIILFIVYRRSNKVGLASTASALHSCIFGSSGWAYKRGLLSFEFKRIELRQDDVKRRTNATCLPSEYTGSTCQLTSFIASHR